MYRCCRQHGFSAWISLPLINLEAPTNFELSVIENECIRNHRPSLNVPFVWRHVQKKLMTENSFGRGEEMCVNGRKARKVRKPFRRKPLPHRSLYPTNAEYVFNRFCSEVITSDKILHVSRIRVLVNQLVVKRQEKANDLKTYIRWLAVHRPFVIYRIFAYIERNLYGSDRNLAKVRLLSISKCRSLQKVMRINIKLPFIPGYNIIQKFREYILQELAARIPRQSTVYIMMNFERNPKPREILCNTKHWIKRFTDEDFPCTCEYLKEFLKPQHVQPDELTYHVGTKHVCIRASSTAVYEPLQKFNANFDTPCFPSRKFVSHTLIRACNHITRKLNIVFEPEPFIEPVIAALSSYVSLSRPFDGKVCICSQST